MVMAASVFVPSVDAKKKPKPPKIAGMVYVESSQSFEDTRGALAAALDANPNLRRVADIDHQAAAAQIGQELGPNLVMFFGNPSIGTPLMQQNQLAGIDLPQRFHIVEVEGQVYVGFNDATYLAARHGLDAPQLDTIAAVLRALAETAAGPDTATATKNAARYSTNPGFITVTSDADIDTTWNRLLAAIDASPANPIFSLDHQRNAATVGLELRPTRLLVFGSAAIGTPLMQDEATVGMDLPLKILVWEDESGQVQVTANSSDFLRKRHRVKADLSGVSGALGAFLAAAAGN